jgi:hypothetical protein
MLTLLRGVEARYISGKTARGIQRRRAWGARAGFPIRATRASRSVGRGVFRAKATGK